MKRARESVHLIRARGKRKLSKESLTAFPKEIIGAFVRLPRVFKKMDLDKVLGDEISRSMKWRYVRRMERLGLVRHSTKKYYQKIYDSVSDWMEKDAVPKIKHMESIALIERI
ncbi:MAG: hypothetical protein ABSA81_04600 [Candidatus Bathyarchaeia archaeon]|jgi:hypothetical protein